MHYMISDVKAAINATPLIHYLNAFEIDRLLGYMKVLNFSKGEFILHQGQISEGIYILVEGSAFLTARTLESGETHLALLKKGDFLGEISFLMGEPSATSIIASSDSTCLLLSNIYLEFLSVYFPDEKYKIVLAIAKQICDRLKKTNAKILTFLEKSDMPTQPILGRVMESLIKPTITELETIDIPSDQLQKMDSFSVFNQREYEALFKNAKLIKAPKHCNLIKQEDHNAGCYIVIRGAVQSSIIHKKIVAKLSVIGPILLFCSVSTIDAEAESFVNYTTCEQAILLKFSQSDLLSIQKNNKALWDKLFNLICKSLVALEKSVQKLDIRLNVEFYNR